MEQLRQEKSDLVTRLQETTGNFDKAKREVSAVQKELNELKNFFFILISQF